LPLDNVTPEGEAAGVAFALQITGYVRENDWYAVKSTAQPHHPLAVLAEGWN